MINITEKEITNNWRTEIYNEPEVTIWCTAYNHEKYISQCLDSFLMQKTNFPFVIIVHDDASCDHTADVICEYVNMFPNIIKLIKEKENIFSKGRIPFGNIMVEHLKSKYVATCEGDDYWCVNDKLQKQYDFMENHNEYSIVGHMTKSVDKDDKLITTFIDSMPGEYGVKEIERWQLFAHYSSYFYRNVFLNMSQRTMDEFFTVKVPGDRKYPILFMQYGKLYVLPEEMSVYRYQSCQTSYTNNTKNKLYKVYIEYEELEKYALSKNIKLDCSDIKNQHLVNSFIRLILCKSIDFFKILKIRKKYVKDLGLCLRGTLNCLHNKIVKSKELKA